MILVFPDSETLRLTITSGVIPATMTMEPIETATDAAGRISVEPVNSPSRGVQGELKKLGIRTSKTHLGEVRSLTCWPKIFSLHREANAPETGSQTPILFEMAAEQLPMMVGEMLRLGNDRQSFRYFSISKEEPLQLRVLLRVLGPPYYTLLRALEKSVAGSVRAYLEAAAGVWVEYGYSHPFGTRLRPADKELLLLQTPDTWITLEDAGFSDIYEIIDFRLPGAGIEWQAGELKGKLNVPLRLVAGNAADQPEMWVLRKNAIEQFDTFVRDSDERLMSRLSFAVAGESEAEKMIVIRLRPSKLQPPVLPLTDAVGFRPFWKLPNLFLPVGTRLQPTLRRDAVRKLLADDPAKIVWLMPGENGQFNPETLPDDVFRPLEDWIDYVIDHESAALKEWVEATEFDFDSFSCTEDMTPRPKDPPGSGKKKDTSGEETGTEEGTEKKTPKTRRRTRSAEEEAFTPEVVMPVVPGELKKKREELEKVFLEHEGPLDSPERLKLWPELASINAALRETPDAAICWMNAIWESEEVPQEWLREWVEAEISSEAVTGPVIDQFLNIPSPSPGEVRALSAVIIFGSGRESSAVLLRERLPKIRTFLESHERVLGVRAVWLGWLAVTRLSGFDVLGLARVRDRLLQRLLDEGLNKERDLPSFMRFAGLRDSERLRIVRDRALRLREYALKWLVLDTADSTEVNHAYLNLFFAFGLARLGEATSARDLLKVAEGPLLAPRDNMIRKQAEGRPDPVHTLMLDAFRYRVESSLAGKPHSGSLSPELLDRLKKLESLPRYAADRMRQEFRVLEPQEKFHVYLPYMKLANALGKELGELSGLKKPAELEHRIWALVSEGIRTRQPYDTRALILKECLPLAPRVGETFTLKLLDLVPEVLRGAAQLAEASPDARSVDHLSELVDRALFQAAHFDRIEHVESLIALMMEVLRGLKDKKLHRAVNLVVGQCLRTLRKASRQDRIHQIIGELSDLVIQNQSLPQLRHKHPRDWMEVCCTLLHIASGWMYFGEVDKAMPFLDEARAVLHETEKLAGRPRTEGTDNPDQKYAELARTYASVLAQAPVEMALNRIEDLFRHLAKLPNTFTTKDYYSRLHLNIVEDVVLSVVSDEFAMGPAARRWLDDDEYLVRRRIHGDMRKLLLRSGL